MPKNRFFRHISGNKFFPKIGLRYFLGIVILHLYAKNQKKLMSQSREKLVTDERTDERTWVNLKDLRGRSKNWKSKVLRILRFSELSDVQESEQYPNNVTFKAHKKSSVSSIVYTEKLSP